MAITLSQASRAAVGVGALLVACAAWQWWDGERAFARMRATTCTVVSRSTDTTLLLQSRRRTFHPPTARIREEVHLVLAHTVDGRRHEFREDFVYDWAEYAKIGYVQGQDYPCRYDPLEPDRGTVRESFSLDGPGETFAGGVAVILLAAIVPSLVREVARLRATGQL